MSGDTVEKPCPDCIEGFRTKYYEPAETEGEPCATCYPFGGYGVIEVEVEAEEIPERGTARRVA